MADNSVMNPGAGGDTIRDFADGSGVKWPACIVSYITGGSAGAWTLQGVDGTHGLPVNVLNATLAVTGTFWQATQPISAAGLPLPAGAATAAKQPALGTAGSASADVLTVQGIASMTALKVDGSSVTQPVSIAATLTVQGGAASGAAASGNPLQIGAVYNAAQPTVTTGQAVQLQATARGALIVATGVDTFHATIDNATLAVTQSGTWTVATNADAALGAGTAPAKCLVIGGQYNSAAPTPASGQTVALQVDANGLLKVNVAAGGGSGGTSSSFGAAFPATGTAIGASDGTNMKGLLVDASGFLKVNVAAGSGGNGAASNTGSAVPAQADYVGLNVAGTLRGQTGVNPSGSVYAAQMDLASVAGATVLTGHGTAAGAIRVELPTDGTGLVNAAQSGTWNIGTVTTLTTLTGITNAVTVVGAAASGASKSGNPVQVGGVFNTTQPTVTTGQMVEAQYTARGAALVATGVDTFHATIDNATLAVTQSGTWSLAANQSVNVAQVAGAAIAQGHGTAAAAIRVELPTDGTGVVGLNAGSNVVGKVGIDQTTPGTTNAVQTIPGTSGGLSVNSQLSTAAVISTSVKASAGQVYGLHCFNNTSTIAYGRLYNQTTAPASTDNANILYRFTIPANTNAAGFVVPIPDGLAFATGIGLRVTGAVADTDTTALAANQITMNVLYK